MMKTAATVVLVATTAAFGTPPPEPSYVDVRSYMPEGFVTDGSIDYKPQIQKCLDENACVYFAGSNDPAKPIIYGSMAGLKTRRFAWIRFGPNAVLKRLVSNDTLITLARGTHLRGAVIDGNKYAHWPRFSRGPGNAIAIQSRCVLEDCFVYNSPGTAYSAWGASYSKLYRCRAENCGYLDVAYGTDCYTGRLGDNATADGFYTRGHHNLVKDCAFYDCDRWGIVVTGSGADNTFVDCKGGDINVLTFGFVDFETDGGNNRLIRCQSLNSHITIMGDHDQVVDCIASHIDAQNADHARIVGNMTTVGPILVGDVASGVVAANEAGGREAPFISDNRVFLSRPWPGGAIVVNCKDGFGIVRDNVVHAFVGPNGRSGGLQLHNLSTQSGNIVKWGPWSNPTRTLQRPSYSRARYDHAMLARRKEECYRQELAAYLPKLGIAGKPAYQHLILGEFPFLLDEQDVGLGRKWYVEASRPKKLGRNRVGWHWRKTKSLQAAAYLGKTFGPTGPGWHFVTFDFPAEHVGRETHLHLGGVDEHCAVWLNGRSVGEHHHWFDPFHLNVTKAIKAGRNDLVIRVTTGYGPAGIHKPIAVIVK